jgi:hypothetical protein
VWDLLLTDYTAVGTSKLVNAPDLSAHHRRVMTSGLCTRRAPRRSTAKREVGPILGAHVRQVVATLITPSVSALVVKPSSGSSGAPVQPDEPVARRLR